MTIPNIHKREIPPTHPGEMLREDFMPDYHLTPTSLASALGVSRQTVHDLLKEKRAVTPLMALRLSRLFGNSQNFGRGHSRQETCGNLNNNISMISITFIRLHRNIKVNIKEPTHFLIGSSCTQRSTSLTAPSPLLSSTRTSPAYRLRNFIAHQNANPIAV